MLAYFFLKIHAAQIKLKFKKDMCMYTNDNVLNVETSL
jgi:hypothetical protein